MSPVRLPARLRGPLPYGHPWVILKDPATNRLTVVLSTALPRRLEHQAVKAALHEWHRHRRPGLVVIPIGLATGLGRLARHIRPTRHVAAGTAAGVTIAAMAGYALTSHGGGHHAHPPAALAPAPSSPRVPGRPHPGPSRSKTRPKIQPKIRPRQAAPRISIAPIAVIAPTSPVTVPVTGPVTPPVHVPRPPVVVPPVNPPPPVVRPAHRYLLDVRVVTHAHLRLLNARIGRLAHIRIGPPRDGQVRPPRTGLSR